MSKNYARRASQEKRLISTIKRYDKFGEPTEFLASTYQIVPIPDLSLRVKRWRLWIKGESQNSYDSIEDAQKEIRRLVTEAEELANK